MVSTKAPLTGGFADRQQTAFPQIWRLLRFATASQSQRFSQEGVGDEKACEPKAYKYRSNKRQTVQWNCPATLADLAQESASADQGSGKCGHAPSLPGR